jgi:hypothetical protein
VVGVKYAHDFAAAIEKHELDIVNAHTRNSVDFQQAQTGKRRVFDIQHSLPPRRHCHHMDGRVELVSRQRPRFYDVVHTGS